ncbi:MAG TPA: hypothetical protein VFM32_01885 [Spongiibacteraceae bacterium]|nr:hypothetical protein [Spongiibacteraceae bacterium]
MQRQKNKEYDRQHRYNPAFIIFTYLIWRSVAEKFGVDKLILRNRRRVAKAITPPRRPELDAES